MKYVLDIIGMNLKRNLYKMIFIFQKLVVKVDQNLNNLSLLNVMKLVLIFVMLKTHPKVKIYQGSVTISGN